MDRVQDFREYVERSWPRLVRTARLLGSSPVDAEDAVQATLLKVYVAWARVARADNIDAYVYRILVNTRISAQRGQAGRESPTAVPETGTVPDSSSQVLVADAVVRALQKLSPRNRAVVVLRYYADLSEPQIAAALGIAVGTVKSRLHRGQAQLQQDPALLEAFEGEAR